MTRDVISSVGLLQLVSCHVILDGALFFWSVVETSYAFLPASTTISLLDLDKEYFKGTLIICTCEILQLAFKQSAHVVYSFFAQCLHSLKLFMGQDRQTSSGFSVSLFSCTFLCLFFPALFSCTLSYKYKHTQDSYTSNQHSLPFCRFGRYTPVWSDGAAVTAQGSRRPGCIIPARHNTLLLCSILQAR